MANLHLFVENVMKYLNMFLKMFLHVIVTLFVFSPPVGYSPPAFLFRLTAILSCTK